MKKFKISNFDIGMPVVLAGAGILTLIICLIVLIPTKKSPDENRDLQNAVSRMEARIAELENQLNSIIARLETKGASSDAVPENVLSENALQLQTVAEQMASIQKKVDYIDKRQGNLEQRVVSLSSAPPKKADSPRTAAKPASKKERASKQTEKSAPRKETASKQTTKPAEKKQDLSVTQAAAKSAKYHTVAAGETRYGIARKYGLTVAQLDGINGFSAKTVIQPGQKDFDPEVSTFNPQRWRPVCPIDDRTECGVVCLCVIKDDIGLQIFSIDVGFRNRFVPQGNACVMNGFGSSGYQRMPLPAGGRLPVSGDRRRLGEANSTRIRSRASASCSPESVAHGRRRPCNGNGGCRGDGRPRSYRRPHPCPCLRACAGNTFRIRHRGPPIRSGPSLPVIYIPKIFSRAHIPPWGF